MSNPESPTGEFTQEDLIAGLASSEWRLNNLYKIVDKKKNVVTFRMNNAQRNLYENCHTRVCLLKSRKAGFSTFIQLLMLDTVLFSPNESGVVIAQDRDIAETIFRNVIRFAYDHLPPVLKNALPTEGQPSQSVIAFPNGSRVTVSTSARGTTPTFLHVSEFGKIAAKDPVKSREIITGSITAVAEDGLIFVESTAEGRNGDFYDLVKMSRALLESGRPLWKLDFKFYFFGWWQDISNVAPANAILVTDKDEEYFTLLEQAIKTKLSPEQKAWYVMFRERTYFGSAELMLQEQPGTPDEAFQISLEGSYFKAQFSALRKQKRIGLNPYDPQFPVSLFFDLGANDCTAIWYVQAKRTHVSVIDYYEASGEPFAHYVKVTDEKNYVLGDVYLPHDAAHRRQGADRNETPEEMLNNVAPHWRSQIVARTADKLMAIQQARSLLQICVFDESKCSTGLLHLENYRKEWNARTGTWKNTPYHGPESNGADAFLQCAQAISKGIFGHGSYFSEMGQAAKVANTFNRTNNFDPPTVNDMGF